MLLSAQYKISYTMTVTKRQSIAMAS